MRFEAKFATKHCQWPSNFCDDITKHSPFGKGVSGIVALAPNLSITASLKNPGADGSFWICFNRSIIGRKESLCAMILSSRLIESEDVRRTLIINSGL